MGKTCVIIGAGADPGTDWLRRRVSAGDLLIAADGGYESCVAAGLVPDILVGDFDSMSPEKLSCVPDTVELCKLPVEKDDTDMLHAAALGVERGCEVFRLLRGTGGRPDHSFANYQTLLRLARQGRRAYLEDPDYVVTAVVGGGFLTLPAKDHGTVSVFSMGEMAVGVRIKGLKYEVEEAVLTNDFPLGCSNSFVGKSAEISVRDGAVLVMWESS